MCVTHSAKPMRNLPRLMDTVIRSGSPPQPERHWHRRYAMAAGMVMVLAALSACGRSASPQSSAQVSLNDLNAGLSAEAAGRLTEAATDYKNAITQDPHDNYAYYDLGLVQQLTGQTAASEVNYRACLQIDPNYVPALFNLAILRTTPSPTEAEELYRHVIALQPTDGAAHLNLAFLLRSEGRTAEADAEFRLAVHFDPSAASRIPPGVLATPKAASPSPTPH